MKRSICLILCLFLCLTLLTGCISMSSYNQVVRTPHVESPVNDEYGAVPVSNADGLYETLRDAILRYDPNVLITRRNYSGQFDADTEAVVARLETEPFIDFSVDRIRFTKSLTLGNNEVSVDISYNLTKTEFFDVISVGTISELKDNLAQGLLQFKTSFIYEIHEYDPQLYSIDEVIEDILLEHPVTDIRLQSIEREVYPEDGSHCIISIDFDYNISSTAMQKKREILEERKKTILPLITKGSDPLRFHAIYNYLTDGIQFDEDTFDEMVEGTIFTANDAPTVFGALVDHRATCKGFAAAMTYLCNAAEIPVKTVVGTYNGHTHYWNIVMLNGAWFYTDPALEAVEGKGGHRLLTDQTLLSTHTWIVSDYPTCGTEGERLVRMPK